MTMFYFGMTYISGNEPWKFAIDEPCDERLERLPLRLIILLNRGRLVGQALTISVCVFVPFMSPALITVFAMAMSDSTTVISSSLLRRVER